MMISLKLLPDGKTRQFPKGTLLLDAILDMGVSIKSPCGGKGICGKCLTRIKGNLPEVTEIEAKILKNKKSMRLSCQTLLAGDAEVFIDENRFAERKTYPLADPNEPYAIAVDVGTTSVNLDLLSLPQGMVFQLDSFLNPQRRFGHDVISRIAAANNPEIHRAMTQKIRQAIFGAVKKALDAMALPFLNIEKIIFSGNTTMLYLLFGLEVSSLGQYPFPAEELDFLNFSSKNVGADLFPEARISAMPAVSAFLGSDLMGGLTLCHEKGFTKNTFFIDLGTNGELFLLNGIGSIYAASCAMGPALEGMNISWGMTADDGAVTHARIDEETLEYEMIGAGSPVGLTGTALIDIIAGFLKKGLIQQNGAFAPDLKERKLPRPARYFEGAKSKQILLWDDIAVSQKDVRNLQLAKGASLAASRLLLKTAGCTADEVRHVMVAGALGSHLTLDNFKRLGFLPEFPNATYHDLGNTSLQAAGRAGVQDDFIQKAVRLRDRVTELNLAANPDFSNEFITAMDFPEKKESK